MQTSTEDVIALQNQPDEQQPCFACAAPLHVTPSARQKGYMTCAYCHTITLFYMQNSHELILGQPDFNKMVFKVVCKADKAGVLWNKDRRGVLLLKGYRIKRLPMNAALEGKRVERIGVRETAVPQEVGFTEMISGKAAKKVEQDLA